MPSHPFRPGEPVRHRDLPDAAPSTYLRDSEDGLWVVLRHPDGREYRAAADCYESAGPPPGAVSSVTMAIPEGATASVAPAPASNCRLTNFVNLEYQPQYTAVCGPQ